MKRISCSLYLPAFVLALCVLSWFSPASEASNTNETVTAMSKTNLSVTTMVPPDSVNTTERGGNNEEKKLQAETEKSNGEERTEGSSEVGEHNNGKQQKIENSTETKDEPLEKSNSGDNSGSESVNSKSTDNASSVGDSNVEGCDPSNRCSDGKNKLVACLRVPGKDSLDLSLLIQNKGEEALNVEIVAPDAVKLEESTVTLQGKENKEVKVSIDSAANDTTITLKTGDGICKLSYLSIIPKSVRQASRMAGYMNLVKHTSTTTVLLAAGAVLVVALLFIRFLKTRHQEGSSKYQKVETSLPVSTGGVKKNSDDTDGWDESWGDDWDDEETPKTPTKLVSTPSSKGLASRKLNKDGWKD